MATYNLSLEERRARAQAIKEHRENRYALANYINQQKKAESERAEAILQKQIDWENERNSQGFIVRTAHTIGDLASNVITGAIKGLEGVLDLGATVIGGIGGIFDNEFQNNIKDFVAKDWTGEYIGNPLQELNKYSYTENGGIIENVASGVGQMLPAVAVSILTAGAGAPAAVAEAASLGTLGASAAGNSTESAFNDGADYWNGLGYGVASGLIEVATEKLTGGLTKGVFGKGLLDNVGKSVATTGVKRIVKGALEEGAEEIIAELANPTLKAIYKGGSAFQEYTEPEYWKGVAEAGLVGGLTSIAYGGTVGKIINTAQGINENISDSLAQIDTLEKKRNNLFFNDKLTEQNDIKIAENLLANYRNVETALQNASEKNRAKYIKNYNLSNMFESNGTMKPDFASRFNSVMQNGQTSTTTDNVATNSLASLDKRYYHPSLRGQEQYLTEQLAKQGTKVYSGELTETEQANYSRMKKTFNALSQKGLVSPDFVLAESSDDFHSYLDGKTIVIGKDTLESDLWQQKLIHEVEHFTEGTKEWVDFASFVLGETDTSQVIDSILKKDYGITQNDVDTLQTALTEGNVTDKQRLLLSEIVASQSEYLFGSEQMIERLASKKRGLARKILDRIKNFVKILKAKTPEERNIIKKLEKAQKLFEKALEKSGVKYLTDKVDTDSEIQYNKKRKDNLINQTFPTYKESAGSEANELATRWAHKENVMVGDKTAISYKDNWYLIEKFSDSDWGYQIIEKLTEQEYLRYEEEWNNGNRQEQSIQEGISRFASFDRQRNNSFRRESDNDFTRFKQRGENKEIREVGGEQTSKGQTASNRRGDSQSGSSSDKVKFSLKDTVENDVLSYYGTTRNWKETGYILQDGKRLDLSGRREGASGGYRTVDHRDIFNMYEDIDGGEALVEFMARGNIRVNPEYPGINLQVEPTAEQYKQIGNLVESLGWSEETFSVDFDSPRGFNIDTLEYDGKVSANKVISDIKFFFKEGKLPYQSDLSKFRYSLKDKYFYNLSDGQVKKLVANNTKFKKYTKADAESIINNILSSYMNFGDKYGEIRGKSKQELVEILWRGLNTADKDTQGIVALDIAEYIIQNSAMENLWEDIDNQVYVDTIAVLKPYLHKIDLSGLRSEIKYHYDKDNSPYLIWGKRKGQQGVNITDIVQELGEQGFLIEATSEADIFIELDNAYRNALQALKKQAKTMLNDSLTKEERNDLKQKIAREVLHGYDYTGEATKLSKIIDKYVDKAKLWKQKYLDERKRNSAINRLMDKTQKLKDIKLGTFINASQYKSDIFKGSIEKLSNIKFRGDLNKKGTRKIVAGLAEWYSKDNAILEGVFDEDISYMLEKITTGKGNLTTDEIIMLENVVGYFTHFVETYNKVYRNGKYEDALPIAKSYVEIVQQNKNLKVGWFTRTFEKMFNNPKASYIQTFADPMTVARYMDKYESGFYSEILATLRDGAVNASIMEMEMREPLEEFYKKHKRYLKDTNKRTIEYEGLNIPIQQAMLLYMTLNRDQALLGLAESGFVFEGNKSIIRHNGFANAENLTIDELRKFAKEQQAILEKQFTELDKEYIAIAEELFNNTCKVAKQQTDLKRKGYSNILEGYYIPIRRSYVAHSIDTSTFQDEMDRVSNATFNKDTMKGAKNELFIEALESVLNRHIRAITQYANLSIAIDEYNKLFNLDISGNPNKPINVRTESDNLWRKGNEYFNKLISDIQGIPVVKGAGAKAMSFIRSGYAKYQLGANPKVWVTQLSSFFAAGSILDTKSITKGFNIKASDVDEYCPLAKVRNNDNTVALAQGVIENVGKIGDILMKPIGKVDRFVIKKLFGACQVQVEKDNALKIGTIENKKKAGELLTKVILETQQNSLATERSAAMRSGSELAKTLTMFSADAMKVVGRVMDSIGELTILKQKRKATSDTKMIAELDKKIKSANKKVRKSVTSLVTSSIFMALIAKMFSWLYNKDDDDEEFLSSLAVDSFGNLLGGLPIFKDIYARLAEGYDIDNYAYSTINDLLDSAQNIFEMATDIKNGNEDNIPKNIRSMLYSVGQLFGIPVRNMYNVGYGLINRFSPSTGYKIDDMFYNKNYRADLKKAIEEDDEDMLATIVGIMLDENIGEVQNTTVRKEIDKLIKAGYDVIPKGVGNSITYEGETMQLTKAQVAEFKFIYATAHKAVASLVNLSQYTTASAEVQAQAMKFIYNTYYNLALEDMLGVDLESKNTLFAEAIDIEKLAIIIATAKLITADMDKNGKALSGTRKAKIQTYINSLQLSAVQKYMIMGYLGYSNTKGEQQVKSYINRLSLNKNEKAQLLKWSGYTA